MSTSPSWFYESLLWQCGYSTVAGVDEAGRGALAGPVVAGVVVLPYGSYTFKDSKQLSAKRREVFAQEIKHTALAWATGMANANEIDNLNILKATHLAAERAIKSLKAQIACQGLITDYLSLAFPGPVFAFAKAESLSYQVAAASILAKTTRDMMMKTWAISYPEYGFEQHKGYGSSQHRAALEHFGPCPLHRTTFAPVSALTTHPSAVSQPTLAFESTHSG